MCYHEAYMTTIINKSKSLTIPVDARLASCPTRRDAHHVASTASDCVENLNAKPRKKRLHFMWLHLCMIIIAIKTSRSLLLDQWASCVRAQHEAIKFELLRVRGTAYIQECLLRRRPAQVRVHLESRWTQQTRSASRNCTILPCLSSFFSFARNLLA